MLWLGSTATVLLVGAEPTACEPLLGRRYWVAVRYEDCFDTGIDTPQRKRVRPDGVVTDVTAENESIDNAAYGKCIADQWWFPVTQNGGASSRVFDFSW